MDGTKRSTTQVAIQPKVEKDTKVKAEPLSPDPRKSSNAQASDLPSEALTHANIAIRVANKEKAVQHGLFAVQQMIDYLRGEDMGLVGLENLKKHMDLISMLSNKPPQTCVGVWGGTGVGKSSFINAMIGECVLPRNSYRASTSVVVEISWNTSERLDETYAAEIEYLSKKQWLDEFEILAHDIRNHHEEKDNESRTLVDEALAKINAVYPSNDIKMLLDMGRQQLLSLNGVSKILGQKSKIFCPNIKSFSQEIQPYVDNVDADLKAETPSSSKAAFWPLVKLVKIYLKAEVLKNGLVLVDMPGCGDSNAARSKVAERYLQNLDNVWVVAPVTRAVSDHVAKELMGKLFKRRLMMDGKYNDFISFIVTKIDEIDTGEVITSRKLDRSVLKEEVKQEATLHAEIEEKANALKEHKLATRKRKHVAIDNPVSDDQLKALKADLRQSQKQLDKLQLFMKTVCISERNDYVKKTLEDDFQAGLHEMEGELKTKKKSRVKKTPELTLNAFCVSSKGFLHQLGQLRQEQKKAFAMIPSKSASNIPKVQSFAVQLTLPSRELYLDRLYNHLGQFIASVKLAADEMEVRTVLSTNQRQQLTDAQDVLSTKCKQDAVTALQNFKKGTKARMTRGINDKVQLDLSKWEEETIYSEDFSQEVIKVRTWKAICVRKGDWKKRTNPIRWNAAFLDLYLKPLTCPWREAIQQRLFDHFRTYSTRIDEAIDAYLGDFERSVVKACGFPSLPGSKVLENKVQRLKSELHIQIKDAFERLKKRAAIIRDNLEPKIQERMLEIYKTCVDIKGIGALGKMEIALKVFVTTKAQSMYKEVGEGLVGDLKDMIEKRKSELSNLVTETQKEIDAELLSMIRRTNPSRDGLMSDKKRARLLEVLAEYVKELESVWAAEWKDPAALLEPDNPFQKDDDEKPDMENMESEEGSESESDEEDDNEDDNEDRDLEKEDDEESDAEKEDHDMDDGSEKEGENEVVAEANLGDLKENTIIVSS